MRYKMRRFADAEGNVITIVPVLYNPIYPADAPLCQKCEGKGPILNAHVALYYYRKNAPFGWNSRLPEGIRMDHRNDQDAIEHIAAFGFTTEVESEEDD